MRVPPGLSDAFDSAFEELIAGFAAERGFLDQAADIRSSRFLSRCIVPHVQRLSSTFNRLEKDQDLTLNEYWKEGSNPANLRLAYFLYFMPSNIFRIAAIWAELQRFGFRWNAQGPLAAIEIGAGSAAGACGIACGERFAPVGLPSNGRVALVEQDKTMLDIGSAWAKRYFASMLENGSGGWHVRGFRRKIDLGGPILPESAPRFNLWIMSFFLNEVLEDPAQGARALLSSWRKHLDDEGVVIIAEPALKLQSRKLLELRRILLDEARAQGLDWLKVLLPCLGHQNCGALADSEDWCHEEVSWWRPAYFKLIDKMAGLDRKTLPFSYLVLVRSKRSHEELLPLLGDAKGVSRSRLVSPPHKIGGKFEFFACSRDGKFRVRKKLDSELQRGDIIFEGGVR